MFDVLSPEPLTQLDRGKPVLEIRRLRTELPAADGPGAVLVDDVSLEIAAGETLAVVGEVRLGQVDDVPLRARRAAAAMPGAGGTVLFEGRDLTQCGTEELRRLRGARHRRWCSRTR